MKILLISSSYMGEDVIHPLQKLLIVHFFHCDLISSYSDLRNRLDKNKFELMSYDVLLLDSYFHIPDSESHRSDGDTFNSKSSHYGGLKILGNIRNILEMPLFIVTHLNYGDVKKRISQDLYSEIIEFPGYSPDNGYVKILRHLKELA